MLNAVGFNRFRVNMRLCSPISFQAMPVIPEPHFEWNHIETSKAHWPLGNSKILSGVPWVHSFIIMLICYLSFHCVDICTNDTKVMMGKTASTLAHASRRWHQTVHTCTCIKSNSLKNILDKVVKMTIFIQFWPLGTCIFSPVWQHGKYTESTVLAPKFNMSYTCLTESQAKTRLSHGAPFLSLSYCKLSFLQIMVTQIWGLGRHCLRHEQHEFITRRQFTSCVANFKKLCFQAKIRSLENLNLSPWAFQVSQYLKMFLIKPYFAKNVKWCHSSHFGGWGVEYGYFP